MLTASSSEQLVSVAPARDWKVITVTEIYVCV